MDKIILSPYSLSELMESMREVVREEIVAFNQNTNDNKLLSPAEVCKLFSPNISRVTLSSWTKQGFLQQQRIGGRVYYKHSVVMEAVKTMQRYKRSVGSKHE